MDRGNSIAESYPHKISSKAVKQISVLHFPTYHTTNNINKNICNVTLTSDIVKNVYSKRIFAHFITCNVILHATCKTYVYSKNVTMS